MLSVSLGSTKIKFFKLLCSNVLEDRSFSEYDCRPAFSIDSAKDKRTVCWNITCGVDRVKLIRTSATESWSRVGFYVAVGVLFYIQHSH